MSETLSVNNTTTTPMAHQEQNQNRSSDENDEDDFLSLQSSSEEKDDTKHEQVKEEQIINRISPRQNTFNPKESPIGSKPKPACVCRPDGQGQYCFKERGALCSCSNSRCLPECPCGGGDLCKNLVKSC